MQIDWATLGTVAIVAAAAAVTVVLLVAFALVGLSVRLEQHAERPAWWGSGNGHTVGVVIAGLCLLAAGLIVCFGLYLIIA